MVYGSFGIGSGYMIWLGLGNGSGFGVGDRAVLFLCVVHVYRDTLPRKAGL